MLLKSKNSAIFFWRHWHWTDLANKKQFLFGQLFRLFRGSYVLEYFYSADVLYLLFVLISEIQGIFEAFVFYNFGGFQH